jgi:hypothetical protein
VFDRKGTEPLAYLIPPRKTSLRQAAGLGYYRLGGLLIAPLHVLGWRMGWHIDAAMQALGLTLSAHSSVGVIASYVRHRDEWTWQRDNDQKSA